MVSTIKNTESIEQAYQGLLDAKQNFISACARIHIAESDRPRIGEYLTGQGGIYIGDILGDDGVLYGLIAAKEDAGKAQWGNNGEEGLSEWDGLTNTNTLRDKSPAAKQAADYECDGHCDFYLPARRELIVALANTPSIFEKDSWYWTSTPISNSYAWAVDFEYGDVRNNHHSYEFRVRPFRRFPI